MFIAKISRGRTIRAFINGTITMPIVYSFMWMVLFGGIGIRKEREAGYRGLCCMDESNWFIGLDNSTLVREAAPNNIKDMLHNATIDADPLNSVWMCEGGECGSCAFNVIKQHTEFSGSVSIVALCNISLI
jgi:ferredoxin